MTLTLSTQLPTSSILWFEDSAAADPRRVGGKAAALAGLADRLPVPPGFVSGMDELLDAIAACRASGNTDRALQYRRANGLAAPTAPLPVLVQLLVPADAAAVVFSIDPVAPGRGEVLVNAAFGLGGASSAGP